MTIVRHMPDRHSSTGNHSWDPYIPSAAVPWNLRRVVNLHRRAGFAATWSELQRDLKDGPKVSIESPARRQFSELGRAEGFRSNFRHAAGPSGAGRRYQSSQGLVDILHAPRPRPARRAVDAPVA